MKRCIILLSVSILLFNACVPEQEAIEVNPFMIQKGEAPIIFAHRGGMGLFPENTMVAFKGSVDLGVEALEMDVLLTKDGELVTLHDFNIDRTSDGKGNVTNHNYQDLLQYNFASNFESVNGDVPYSDGMIQIPRLEEVFSTFPDKMFMVELKDSIRNGKKAAEELKYLIEKYELQNRISVVCFQEQVLDYFYQITDGKISVGMTEDESIEFISTGLSGIEFLYNPRASLAALPIEYGGYRLDYKRLIKSAHRRNIAIIFWTVDDKETMRDLIEKGVDGIITNRPDIMQELLIEMGY